MKITVPCNVTLIEYYRMYVDVEENTSESDILKAAKEKLLSMDHEEFKHEMIDDPCVPVEEDDIIYMEADVDGTFECYDEEE